MNLTDEDPWNDGAAAGAEGWNDPKPSSGTFKEKADDDNPDFSTADFAEAIGADVTAQGDQACRNCGQGKLKPRFQPSFLLQNHH